MDSNSQQTDSVQVFQKYDTTTTILDVYGEMEVYPTSQLGTIIPLQCSVKKLLDDSPVNEGIVYFSKIINGKHYIIGYSNVDNNGNARVNYKVTDNGPLSFVANFTDSVNYNDSTSNTTNSITIFSKYNTTLTLISNNNSSSQIGSSITLTCSLTSSTGPNNFNDGILYFYKRVSNQIEEIGHLNLGINSNNLSIDYTLIDLGKVEFYASYMKSNNYENNTSEYIEFNVFDKYISQNALSIVNNTNNEFNSYGDFVTLTATITSQNSSNYDGLMEFYRVVDANTSNDELIGTAPLSGTSGIAILSNYTLNSVGSLTFYAKYTNSIILSESKSSLLPITVEKATLNRSSISLILPHVINYLDIIDIVANINLGLTNSLGNLGTFDFVLTDIDNVKSTFTVDVNQNTQTQSILKLLIQKLNYTSIYAVFSGNNLFKSIQSDNYPINIIQSSNYIESLVYTTSEITDNYYNVYARLNIKTEYTDSENITILKNIGNVTFSQVNASGDPVKHIVVPLQNAQANAILYKASTDTITVRFNINNTTIMFEPTPAGQTGYYPP
jgi:hypothetical protein